MVPRRGDYAEVAATGNGATRFACVHCGAFRAHNRRERHFARSNPDPGDTDFGFSLRMKTSCDGGSLWVFNRCHRVLLELFAAVGLRAWRASNGGWHNGSVVSSLSKWMNGAHRRVCPLRCL
jgi:hypothetical protein